MKLAAALCLAVALAACASGDPAGDPTERPESPPPTNAPAPVSVTQVTEATLASATTTVPVTESGTTASSEIAAPATTSTLPTPTPTPTPTTTTTTPTTSTTTTMPAGLRSACRDVVHIGDSTGLAMWTAADMGGDATATLDAQYRAVGVVGVYPDNSGGRSMVERLPDQSTAIEVAEAVRSGGYRGCWVVMIGTNDAANVAAGGVPGLDERIARLMAVIGDEPVLWVNTVSRSTAPAYPNTAMQQFNAALERAAGVYPNLRVLDWASVVQPDWFTADGLHYTVAGRAWRAAITAQSLARAFPASR